MCNYPQERCSPDSPVCPCTVISALLINKCSEAARLLRDNPTVLQKLVPNLEQNGGTRFGLYVITGLPTRFLHLADTVGFKEVVDVVLDNLRQHPPSYQEYRMRWALASEFHGECLWEQEYIDAMRSGEVPIQRKPYLQPRQTPAMIAAWEAWVVTEQDWEQPELEGQWHRLRMPPSSVLTKGPNLRLHLPSST